MLRCTASNVQFISLALSLRKGDDRDRSGNKKGKYQHKSQDNMTHMNGPGVMVSCLTGKERDAARDAIRLFEEVLNPLTLKLTD